MILATDGTLRDISWPGALMVMVIVLVAGWIITTLFKQL
jgi:hypothetical protein